MESLDSRYANTMDQETKQWVCIALSQCVCGNAESQAALGSTGIEAIISVMENLEETSARAKAAMALHKLADNEVNCVYIATLGGVRMLLESLALEDHGDVSSSWQAMASRAACLPKKGS